ncbi:YqzG/YhdC family protein [Fredinandcohnia humi]
MCCLLKKILIGICLTFMVFGLHTINVVRPLDVLAAHKKPVPEYAKWGRLAMKETQKRYPLAQIIDYLHMGRDEKNGTTIERFKLWMRQDNREFGAFVTITFDSKTEEVQNVLIVETNR